MAFIYKIINVANDHFYVGSALNPRRRRWEHWDALKKGTHHCAALQDAWNVFGADAFEFVVVEEVDDARVLLVEDMYLVQNSGSAHCYNTALSTQQPPSVNPATREKIRRSMLQLYADKEKHPRYGKTHSEESKAKISASKLANPSRPWLGKKRSMETRQKISDAQRGVRKGPRVYTPEGLQKARENMRRNAREQKPLDFSEVKVKFPVDVQERYDFSNAVYTGALERIKGCICPIHGEFSQYAAQFRKGRGCPKCGDEQRARSKKAQMLASWGTTEGRNAFMQNRKNK